MEATSAVHKVRHKTIRYLMLFAIPVEAIFCFKSYADQHYFNCFGNCLGLACLIVGYIAASKEQLSDWVPLGLGVYFSLFLVAIIFWDPSRASDVGWVLAVPPVSILCLGTRMGFVISLLFIPVIIIALWYSDAVPQATLATEFRDIMLVTYFLNLLACSLASWVSDSYYKNLRLAQEHIENLEQLLPMCMYCKKVKINREWQAVEAYSMDQGEVRVSHGLCEGCRQSQRRGTALSG